METTTHDVYFASSPSTHQTSLQRPHQTPQRAASPLSACSDAATIKPCPVDPPAYTDALYLDSPPLSPSYHDSSPTTPCAQLLNLPIVFHFATPTDYRLQLPTTSARPSYSSSDDDEDGDDDDDDDDDNVPLAHLLYPRDAPPPAYSTVVSHSYRETLLYHHPPRRYPGAMDADEEAALEMLRDDEVRFTVERAVAMAVVMALLLLGGGLVGLVVFRG